MASRREVIARTSSGAPTSYLPSDTFRASLRHPLRTLLAPLRLWFGGRWRLEAFAFAPEVRLLRTLRRKLLFE